MIEARRSMTGVLVLALVGGSLALTQSAHAQLSAQASISATANVAGVAPITVAAAQDLSFGNVQAGTVGTIANPVTNGGRFDVTAQPSAPVLVSFTLPTALVGPGGGTIPITFQSTDGISWTPFPTLPVQFDPRASTTLNTSNTGTLTLGITGAVSPPALTVSGNYTGSITLTVAY